MLGIGVYGTKQIAAASDVNSTFWNIYAIQLIASILAISVYVIAVFSIPTDGRHNTINSGDYSVREDD